MKRMSNTSSHLVGTDDTLCYSYGTRHTNKNESDRNCLINAITHEQTLLALKVDKHTHTHTHMKFK